MTIVEKLYSGQKLNEKELKALATEWVDDSDGDRIQYIAELEGDESRWTRFIDTIFKVGDDLWDIPWNRGLTEYQENEFWDQPYRVKEVRELVEIVRYVPLEEGNK